MKFLPRVCDPSLFSRLPGTQFPVSMVHSDLMAGEMYSILGTRLFQILRTEMFSRIIHKVHYLQKYG